MKIIEGAFSRHGEQIITNFSDSPSFRHQVDELTEKKVESASLRLLSLSTISRSGGPYNKNPDHAFRLP